MSYCGNEAAPSGKDESIKSSFLTREGTYKLMTLSEYSRPNRQPLPQQGGNAIAAAPVRVSFLSVPTAAALSVGTPVPHSPDARAARRLPPEPPLQARPNRHAHRGFNGATDHRGDVVEEETGLVAPTEEDEELAACPDRICFNVGRELYVYHYGGVRKAADLSKPIDKRIYKGTYPTCHDFNAETATPASCSLLIGFSAGQIQLIDPFRKEAGPGGLAHSRLFNEDRLIDKSRLTGLRWVPGSPQQFLAAHASGHLYVYSEELGCGPGAPSFERFTGGRGFAVAQVKTKSSRNPLFRWSIGEGALNDFHFSPDAKLLAVCSQDGFLRVFDYHKMELVAEMRSYFGGLLSLGWSPDGKYLVTGGEDDLVSVFSLLERRVVCRGQGHRSWISQVAFDPYTTTSDPLPIDLGSEEDLRPPGAFPSSAFPPVPPLRGCGGVLRRGQKASVSSASLGSVCYRFGSVGHDTQLCLWDLTEDVLKQPSQRHRSSVIFPQSPQVGTSTFADGFRNDAAEAPTVAANSNATSSADSSTRKKHKRGFSFGSRLGGAEKKEGKEKKESKEDGGGKGKEETPLRALGTPACPRLDEVPLIEPLVCKKIAHERLTVLAFREDCVVTACQEGFICTWARPGKAGLSHQQSINSPNPGGSPNLIPGGTVV